MRLFQRFVANAVAVFLALYLIDSVARGRFVLHGVWAAVIPALLLGFGDSLVRPLHRARTKPYRALLVAVLSVLVDALVLALLTVAGAVTVTSFGWLLLAAAFVVLVTGAINALIGFAPAEKPRPTVRDQQLRERLDRRREALRAGLPKRTRRLDKRRGRLRDPRQETSRPWRL